MKKRNLFVRLSLFTIILVIGTMAALIVGETMGLALADMSNVSVGAVTKARDSETLYAALTMERQGLYRSDDAGRSWLRVSAGPGAAISALAVHPTDSSLLYAGVVGGTDRPEASLWTSDNSGRSWQRTDLQLPIGPNGLMPKISAVTISPEHPGIVFVGTEGLGLYRYYRETGAFERIGGPGLANLYVDEVVAGGGQVYAVTPEGLLVISGDAWRKIETLPDAPVSVAVDPADSNKLYVGSVGYGAFRSTDGGTTWEAINTGLEWQPGIILSVPAIAVDPQNSEHLTLATAFSVGSQIAPDGIYESLDGGQSWQRIADSRQVVERLTFEQGGIYAATAHGLERYGQPLESTSVQPWQPLRSLVQPTNAQMLVLGVTLALASLTLIGRADWVARRNGLTAV
jgi:photosystem II stability/assembly factor-like uncharacterized protein